MWPFSQAATKAKLQDWKKVRVNGWSFTIRKLNPLLDFPGDRMPQIFTDVGQSRKPMPEKPVQGTEQKLLDDFRLVISKGVVSPRIASKDDGKGEITVDDIMRDGDTAPKLYLDILGHSLDLFKGMRGLFFWLKTRHSLSIGWQKSMESVRTASHSEISDPA
jgi:hypothetical protein